MKDWLIEIIKITIPSVVVLLTSFLVLRELLSNQLQKSKLDLKIANNKIITPLRLQAYERIIIFLERITPESLFLRIFSKDMDTTQLYKSVIQTIRSEFEHNLSQQIYISEDAWMLVVTAKESIIRLMNTAYANESLKENVQEFMKKVIEAYNSVEENPVEAAKKFIKNEISKQIL